MENVSLQRDKYVVNNERNKRSNKPTGKLTSLVSLLPLTGQLLLYIAHSLRHPTLPDEISCSTKGWNTSASLFLFIFFHIWQSVETTCISLFSRPSSLLWNSARKKKRKSRTKAQTTTIRMIVLFNQLQKRIIRYSDLM